MLKGILKMFKGTIKSIVLDLLRANRQEVIDVILRALPDFQNDRVIISNLYDALLSIIAKLIEEKL